MNDFGKDTVLSITIKAIGLLLAFSIQVLLARILGIHLLGSWKLAFSWINIFILIALAGNTMHLIRMVPRKDNEYIHNLSISLIVQSEVFFVLISSVFLGISFLTNSPNYSSNSFRIAFLIAFAYGLINIINKIYHTVLSGKFKNYKTDFINLLCLPICKFGFMCLLYFISKNNYIFILHILLAEIVIFLPTKRFYNKICNNTFSGWKIIKRININLPFLIISLSYMLLSSIDLIMLSFWYDSDKIGGYSVATKISALTMIFCMAFTPFLPKISQLYHKKQTDRLEDYYLTITKIIILFTCPLVIYFIFYGKIVLMFFGKDFITFFSVLSILAIGRFFDAVTGPVGSLLNMTRYEKIDMALVISVLFLNLLLNVVLIPRYGTIGAALATTVSLAIINCIKVYITKHLLRIDTLSWKHIILFLLFGILLTINYIIKENYDINLIFSIIILIVNYALFISLGLLFKTISLKEVKVLYSA